MTIAICLRCGERKVGAFTLCPACSHDPATEPNRRLQAKALWLSDHHLSPEQLDAIGRQLKAREAVAWDQRALDGLVIQLQTQQNALHVGKRPVGCAVFVWGLVAVAVALAAAAAALAFAR